MMAEQWGVPPWTIADAPALWVERWRVYQLERAAAMARDAATRRR